MKNAVLSFSLLLCSSVFATVIELEDAMAKNVIEVYEAMREEQVDVESDNHWIHDFEKESVGTEMDHLTTLKRTIKSQEGM